MASVESSEDPTDRRRRQLTIAIKNSMRELSNQLSLLNHQVGAHLDLKGIDFDCLYLVHRHGPLTPSTLARRTGLHPATLTGVLDRLERGGWISRQRDPNDRRAVLIRALPDRNPAVHRLYSGMNASMDRICAGYDAGQLELLAGFADRLADAGQRAAEELARDRSAG